MRRELRLGALTLLCACGGVVEPPDAGVDAGTPLWPEGALEVGGEGPDGGFITLPSMVEAQPGSQGGYHVPLMYRVTGHAMAGVTFEHRVTRAGDGRLVSKGSRSWDVEPGSSWTTSRPTIVFLCPTPIGVSIVAEPLSFQVTALKDGLLLGTAAAAGTFGCPPGDAFCETICSGD